MMLQKIYLDKLAISLSALCIIHCLAVPVLITLLPVISSLGLADEKFHFWMTMMVIPTSIYALSLGCKKHKSTLFLIAGLIGITFLLLSVFLNHELIGEIGEKLLTVIGAIFIALAHYKNIALCRYHDSCNNSCQV